MTHQTNTNNLNYLIDPTFSKVNRLFVPPLENEDDGESFSKYYTPTVEIKDYNVAIDGKSFFVVPIKNKEETKNLLKWVRIMTILQVTYRIFFK